MKNKSSVGPCDQRTFLDELERFWPVAKGSLAEVRKPCGRKSCIPCREGRKHPAFIFIFRRSGKTLCRHVPRDLVPRLRQAIANGRRMEEALVRAGEGVILQHRKNKEIRRHGA